MTYTCPKCGAESPQPFCKDCQSSILEAATGTSKVPGAPALPVAPGTAFGPPDAREPSPTAHSDPGSSDGIPSPGEELDSPAPRDVRPRGHRLPGRPAATPRATQAPAAAGATSSPELHGFLKDGFEFYLVAGIGGTGKTQMIDAFRRLPTPSGKGGYLDLLHAKRKQGRVMPTSQGSMESYPFHIGGDRKGVLVDASGEDFRDLYPHYRHITGPEDPHVKLLGQIARRLHGLILLLDIEKLRGEADPRYPEHKQQTDILAWILSLVRWLRFDGSYPDPNVKFHVHVDTRVRLMSRRLDIPILVLFSRADALRGLPIPRDASHTFGPPSALPSRTVGDAAHERKLTPVGESPLLIAWHLLPDLHTALTTHARHFRYDFAHSIVLDQTTGTVKEDVPCGIRLSLEWLLEGKWSRSIGTGQWLALQRWLDVATGRSERWRRLPGIRAL